MMSNAYTARLLPYAAAVLALLLALVAQAGPPAASAGAAKNPYTGNAKAIAEGQQLYLQTACNACHGGNGGGGMCPPLINDTWVYGSDDKTLHDLIKGGTAAMTAQGKTRTGHENIVAEMPPIGAVLDDDKIWKILAFVRSKHAGGGSASSGK
jgi:mono/diheme cytochrome c family protein